MNERDALLAVVRGAHASIDQSRQRIDDLNVFPVPDGDTGTNLALTARAVVEALEASAATDRATLAAETTRAALMGARGNSGVILSQIVRGLADVLAEDLDVPRAVRAGADAAYRAVREPVEGTMLTAIRALAEAAEAEREGPLPDLLALLVERGDEAVARTPEQLDVLREAGVVDAGAAGLVELLRGVAATVGGQPLREPERQEPVVELAHQELSRFRYCTTFVVEGDLDPPRIEADVEPLGDSLLVVGDEHALKVHVHTDKPGRALEIGTSAGTIANVEIADMHRQTEARNRRLSLVPQPAAQTAIVAVAIGEGNRRLFESLGATVVDGGETMNPSAAELVAAVDAVAADAVVLLPNNANVILAAEQVAGLASKEVRVVSTHSLQAGLAAAVAFDPARSAEENAGAMADAAASVSTGAVTTASRSVQLNGRRVGEGEYLGLVGEAPVAAGADFGEVARGVVERLVEPQTEVLTLLAGADAPDLAALVAEVGDANPQLEIEVHTGGQPHYALLVSAE